MQALVLEVLSFISKVLLDWKCEHKRQCIRKKGLLQSQTSAWCKQLKGRKWKYYYYTRSTKVVRIVILGAHFQAVFSMELDQLAKLNMLLAILVVSSQAWAHKLSYLVTFVHSYGNTCIDACRPTITAKISCCSCFHIKKLHCTHSQSMLCTRNEIQPRGNNKTKLCHNSFNWNKYHQLFVTSLKENCRTLTCEQLKAATTPTTKQIQQQKCISGNDIIMHDAFSALQVWNAQTVERNNVY